MSIFLNLSQSQIKPFLQGQYAARFKGVLYDKGANAVIVSNGFLVLRIQLQEFEGLKESAVLPLEIFPKRKGFCTFVRNFGHKNFEVKESKMNEEGKPLEETLRYVEGIKHEYPNWRQAIGRQKAMIPGGELDNVNAIGVDAVLLAAVTELSPKNKCLKLEFNGAEKGICFSFVHRQNKDITSNLSGVIMPLKKECYE